MVDQHLQQQLASLKQQQQLQHQILLHQYQQQRQQLEQEHEKQLQEHIKVSARATPPSLALSSPLRHFGCLLCSNSHRPGFML